MRAVWVALLVVALSGCHANKPGSLRIDPALEALAPADSVFVAGANIEAVRSTPYYQKLLGLVSVPQLDEFTRQTGLDPRKDLAEILSCSNGKQAILMARGRFDIAGLQRRLEANGAARSNYMGHTLYGNHRATVVFMNASVAVVGPVAGLRSVIDHKNGGLPPPLRDLVRSIPADDQIWAALNGGLQGFDLGVPEGSNLGNLVRVFNGIDTATLGLDLRNGLNVIAHASCRTDHDAKMVHDMVKGVVGIGRLNTKDDQTELLKLYDAIKVTHQKNQAEVTAQIPPALVDKFLAMWLKK